MSESKTTDIAEDKELVYEFIHRQLFNKGETPVECDEILAFNRLMKIISGLPMAEDNEPEIPCDMWVMNTRFKKGVKVSTVQGAINRLYDRWRNGEIYIETPAISSEQKGKLRLSEMLND